MPFRPMSDAPAMAQSYWEHTAPPLEAPPVFEGHYQTPVLVIGAGFTGLSAALHLAEKSIRSIVLDANQPGWGASGRNNGQVVAALKHEPFEIEEAFGIERGRRLIDAVGNGPDTVFDIIHRYRIECAAKRNGIITVAHSEKAFGALKRRTEIWQARKAPLRILDRLETERSVGTDVYVGASFDPRGGSINPLGYTRGLARAAQSLGATIFRKAEVLQLRRHQGGWQAVLKNGSVTADRVIVGTNAYTTEFWPGLKKAVLPIRTPQIVSRPLDVSPRWPLLSTGVVMSDTRKLIVGVRVHDDGRLHFGGGGGVAGAERESLFKMLAGKAGKLFPSLGKLEWEFRWTGFIAQTPDSYPRLFELAPGVAACLGYSGRGIAMSTLMGAELARWVSGERTIDDLALPVRNAEQLPYYPAKDLLIDGAVLLYALRERFGVEG